MLVGTRGDPGPQASYSMGLAAASYDWYRSHAIRSRKAYKTLEVSALVVTAAIPVTAAIAPGNTTAAAILGAVAVVLSGFRSIFHWQENFIRYSEAREAIEAERRLYNTGAHPYGNKETRDQLLTEAVSRIEQDEMHGWVKIAVERPKP